MISAHEEMIQKHFHEGDDDKGMKKSAALIVEAMIKELCSGGSYPNKKHCIQCVSEVTTLIDQMSTSRKNQSK